MWLTDDEIYFIDQIGFDDMNQTPQGNLCIIDKDGQNKQTLIDIVKNYFKIQGDYIYYTKSTCIVLGRQTNAFRLLNS